MCNVSVCGQVVCVFFFKQKTAYEMRISDWSSDVCSSDLSVAQSEEVPEACEFRIERIAEHGLVRCASGDVTEPASQRAVDNAHVAPADHAVLPQQRQRVVTQGAFRRRRISLEAVGPAPRSEEHTSELQSLMRISYAVFCLK